MKREILSFKHNGRADWVSERLDCLQIELATMNRARREVCGGSLQLVLALARGFWPKCDLLMLSVLLFAQNIMLAHHLIRLCVCDVIVMSLCRYALSLAACSKRETRKLKAADAECGLRPMTMIDCFDREVAAGWKKGELVLEVGREVFLVQQQQQLVC